MAKIISFVIPCYNSEAYMANCIERMLKVGEDIEIVIVDDGSNKDKTPQIADEYQEKYPTIVKAVHQENGGHGAAVMTGVRNASGEYIKVCDSDDWINSEDIITVINKIKEHKKKKVSIDLYLANYVYEHVADNKSFEMKCAKLRPNEIFTWEDAQKIKFTEIILMHSIIYKKSVIIESKLELPKHTFYVDNLYAYKPLPFCKKIYYFDLPLYHYFIGRSDQSVTMENIVKRYDQQCRVNKMIFESYSYDTLKTFPKTLRKYLHHVLFINTNNSAIFTIGGKTNIKERKDEWKALWNFMKEKDVKLYRRLRYRTSFVIFNIFPWPIKRFVFITIYKMARSIFKLG